MPKVSVIVPTFNAGEHIDRTLQSVTAQSLEDIEIVVVDDASTDDTVERVDRLGRLDRRIRSFRNERNRGPSFTRNSAIQKATGVWIAILDADDCMRADRLEVMTSQAEAHAYEILADDVLFVRRHGDAAFDRLFTDELVDDQAVRELDARTFLKLNPPGGSRGIGLIKPIIRADRLRASGIRYREDLRLAEDLFFYLELLMTGARAGLMRPGMYEYLVRADSLSRTKNETDVIRMIQSYDSIIASTSAQGSPDISRLLLSQRREMESYSLPRHRFISALRQGNLATCVRLLWAHPALPGRMLRRKLVDKPVARPRST